MSSSSLEYENSILIVVYWPLNVWLAPKVTREYPGSYLTHTIITIDDCNQLCTPNHYNQVKVQTPILNDHSKKSMRVVKTNIINRHILSLFRQWKKFSISPIFHLNITIHLPHLTWFIRDSRCLSIFEKKNIPTLHVSCWCHHLSPSTLPLPCLSHSTISLSFMS